MLVCGCHLQINVLHVVFDIVFADENVHSLAIINFVSVVFLS